MSSSMASFIRNYPTTLDDIVMELMNVQQQINEISCQQTPEKLSVEKMKNLKVLQEYLADLECLKQRRLNNSVDNKKEFEPRAQTISTTVQAAFVTTAQANYDGSVNLKSASASSQFKKTNTMTELTSCRFKKARMAPSRCHRSKL
jgi:hypothetical protein